MSTGPTGDRFVVAAGYTVRIAGALVVLPELLVTVTLKLAPFVPHVVAGVV
jgi:hypothetical protein